MSELKEYKADYINRNGNRVTTYIQAISFDNAREYLINTEEAKGIYRIEEVPESMSLF